MICVILDSSTGSNVKGTNHWFNLEAILNLKNPTNKKYNEKVAYTMSLT